MKIIEYFMRNKRLNYVLLFFILFLGVNAYQNIPKELFPEIALDKISITGSYGGASAENLDKMAVRDIEDEIDQINGIERVETVIISGGFTIILSLEDGADPSEVLDKTKDAIARSRQYLPSDMIEPTAQILTRSHPLISLSLSTNKMSKGELIEEAKEIKSKIARQQYVSEVKIYGDADQEVSIRLDEEKIKAYQMDPSAVISAVSKLSYIYPIGDIKQSGNYIFLSTVHGKEDKADWESALIKVGEIQFRLGDVASVEITYPQDKTLSTFNGRQNITLLISKGEEGNAIELSKQLRKYAKETLAKEHKNIYFDFYQDTSKPVEDRLNTVISNLLFGLILVFASMALLINLRIATVVAIGIPLSFAVGLIFIYTMGYSINIVSLLGGLIVIGIVVDDAIVVSENIQRHINEGMEKKEAVINGVKEMVLPVSLATLTTIVAFLPLFMMNGEIKNFIILIPITVIMILIGSLIESFLFLPLHAEELLKKQNNFMDWTRLMQRYEDLLHKVIRYKYKFLFTFVVLIPILTVLTLKMLNFQFFPSFDGNYLYISGKAPIDTPIEETQKIADGVEAFIRDKKEKYALKSTATVTGSRVAFSGENEQGENLFYITMELYDIKPQNFIDAYINPVLTMNFNFNDPERIRELHTYEMAKKINEAIRPLQKKYGLEELGVKEQKPGLIKSDIKINLSSTDSQKITDAITKIKTKLQTITYVHDVTDNAQLGKMEYKLRINNYGEQLGLTESILAQTLAGYFLDSRKAMTFGETGVMEIKTRALLKDDKETFINFNLPLEDGSFVKLGDVVTIEKSHSYEKIEKFNGSIVKSVFANVNKKETTAVNVLNQLKPVLDEVRKSGVKVSLLGESEKNEQLKNDMKKAVGIALFLILMSLLFIFPRIRYALMVMSVIPFSLVGALWGHLLLGVNLSMPSVIGMLGLAGVVINDGIIMLDFLHGTHDAGTFYERAKMRLRPILITSITTFLGLFTLIFYATGQAVILQPIAISIGFGLLWGTVLNLVYLPALYAVVNKIKPTRH